ARALAAPGDGADGPAGAQRHPAAGAPVPVAPDARRLLAWHGLLTARDLRAMGVAPPPGEPVAGDWHADPARWAALHAALRAAVAAHARAHPLQPDLPVPAAAAALGLPDPALVAALATAPLRLRDGRVAAGPAPLPPPVQAAVDALRADLAAAPFAAPDRARLAQLGLSGRELAAAAARGLLLRLPGDVVLRPDAVPEALTRLRALPAPFTASEARAAWRTTRRVAIPLLEHLDAQGSTVRVDATRRRLAD
ncbi:MAG TPA: SelB C-terminal domain-containing protein, partial [Pilimelia sp.]|nr:SelB C-terminal domain-containing protein [Pilimelia sp.]